MSWDQQSRLGGAGLPSLASAPLHLLGYHDQDPAAEQLCLPTAVIGGSCNPESTGSLVLGCGKTCLVSPPVIPSEVSFKLLDQAGPVGTHF